MATGNKGEPNSGAIQGERFYVELPSQKPKPKVAMLAFPGLTLLDLVGPQTTLSSWCDVHLVWKNKDAMMSDSGIVLHADTTFDECPADLDVLFVPGGPGQIDPMRDDAVMDFLADRGARAKYVTSVCSGSLVLGAAGLLKGYKATSHWAAMQALPFFGAIPTDERVVTDRNRITGGGVTAGIDFGLTLLSVLLGDETARLQQLAMQYDPAPPFNTGTPASAGPALVQQTIDRLASKGIGGPEMRAATGQSAQAMR